MNARIQVSNNLDGHLLLITSVVFAVFLCQKKLADQFKDSRITLVMAASFWLIAKIYSSIGFPLSEVISDISLIITHSVILVSLLMMIRELKPEIFRYPYITVFMPAIIPFSYYLIYETSLMKDTIVHSVSVMIVLVTLILSFGYRKHQKPFISILVGALLLITSILVSSIFNEEQYIDILWYLATSIGIAATAYGFTYTFNNNIDI